MTTEEDEIIPSTTAGGQAGIRRSYLVTPPIRRENEAIRCSAQGMDDVHTLQMLFSCGTDMLVTSCIAGYGVHGRVKVMFI
jgi:hypothetical protein